MKNERDQEPVLALRARVQDLPRSVKKTIPVQREGNGANLCMNLHQRRAESTQL